MKRGINDFLLTNEETLRRQSNDGLPIANYGTVTHPNAISYATTSLVASQAVGGESGYSLFPSSHLFLQNMQGNPFTFLVGPSTVPKLLPETHYEQPLNYSLTVVNRPQAPSIPKTPNKPPLVRNVPPRSSIPLPFILPYGPIPPPPPEEAFVDPQKSLHKIVPRRIMPKKDNQTPQFNLDLSRGVLIEEIALYGNRVLYYIKAPWNSDLKKVQEGFHQLYHFSKEMQAKFEEPDREVSSLTLIEDHGFKEELNVLEALKEYTKVQPETKKTLFSKKVRSDNSVELKNFIGKLSKRIILEKVELVADSIKYYAKAPWSNNLDKVQRGFWVLYFKSKVMQEKFEKPNRKERILKLKKDHGFTNGEEVRKALEKYAKVKYNCKKKILLPLSMNFKKYKVPTQLVILNLLHRLIHIASSKVLTKQRAPSKGAKLNLRSELKYLGLPKSLQIH